LVVEPASSPCIMQLDEQPWNMVSLGYSWLLENLPYMPLQL
jgi:hypothetical protein